MTSLTPTRMRRSEVSHAILDIQGGTIAALRPP